ncbi:MAG: rhomboid family intramembrane serine protease [Flavobacteriales bacterium]|nr:rhomboid family intramembrane serine protease [Flavobacteriales bacterium]
MHNSQSLVADFEDIETPEIIASLLHLLQSDAWEILNYSDSDIHSRKRTLGSEFAELKVKINKNEVRFICEAELEKEALSNILQFLAQKLSEFIHTPGFDVRVEQLKGHYFMANPVTSHSGVQDSFLKTLFSFKKDFRAVPAIVLLNVLVFVLMILTGVSFMSPETADILNWGANIRTLVLQGDWWRLFTACFIHIGIFHILLNMWALYNIGFFLERMIGTTRFAFAYIIAGLFGSLNSIVWHPATASAGASGAIFGMFGLFLSLLTTNILEKGFRKSMLSAVLPMIIFNLLIGTSAQIDNAGHIGGLLSGMAIGYLYAWYFKNPKNKWINRISFIVPILCFAGSVYAVAKYLPDPYYKYDKIVEKVRSLEQKAIGIEVENQKSNTFTSTSQIWDEAIHELKGSDSLDLRDDLRIWNKRTLYYLERRRENSELRAHPLENQQRIERNFEKIDSVLNLIKNE